ncbi:MAG: amino acid ABC transporter permease [Nocardioidaceae bacterium]|nr:amino acid ABC transporter permease [Nocardioidaceae bacterium]
MAASVLFDEPGPRTRARHRLYGAALLLVIAAFLVWIYLRLHDEGEFSQRIFDDLSQDNVLTAIGDGVVATLKAAAISIVLAVLFGFLLAAGRLSDHAWVRVPSRLVIEFFRAVPVVLMMIFFFGWLAVNTELETQRQALIAVVAALMFYNGSVLAEVFRAGINAVPKGQVEAAYAIGLRKGQVLRMIQTPQAVRYMLPTIISQCVVTLKDTSLGYIITYQELLREGRGIAEFIGNNLTVFLVIAVIYIAMNSVLSALAFWLERRLATRGIRPVETPGLGAEDGSHTTVG